MLTNPSLPSPAVLHVYRTYFPDPPGGLQEAIRQIAISAKAQGINSTIYTLSPNPAPNVLQQPEARVVRYRSWFAPASCDIGGIKSVFGFAESAREAAVIHYLYPWPFADLLREVVNPARPGVLTYISDVVRQRWLGKAYAPLMWRTLRKMKLIVANCPAYAQTSPVLSHPSLRDKVRIIPLGIEENSYPRVTDKSVFERICLPEDSPFFLFIGALRYYKGLEYLVRAAHGLKATIVIAGSGPEGPRLRRMVEDMHLRNVLFAGQIAYAEKVALLNACRALVLPSHLRSEAFGMVLVEAAMFGRPQISCEIGTGTSFVNRHGETGLVVPPGEADALHQAMRVLLTEERQANLWGTAARDRYERMFSGNALGKAYADLFREAAG